MAFGPLQLDGDTEQVLQSGGACWLPSDRCVCRGRRRWQGRVHLPGQRKERREGGVCDSTLSSSREKVADVSGAGAVLGGEPRAGGLGCLVQLE